MIRSWWGAGQCPCARTNPMAAAGLQQDVAALLNEYEQIRRRTRFQYVGNDLIVTSGVPGSTGDFYELANSPSASSARKQLLRVAKQHGYHGVIARDGVTMYFAGAR